jgi:hypothetical protein
MSETQHSKRPKHRSPNYPAISLPKAVEFAKKQYQQDAMQKIPVDIAYQRWGYKAGGSQGDMTLAAMKSYGLIDVDGSGSGRQIQLTETSRKLCLDHPDRDSILKDAALSPRINREVWDHYHGELPKDDVLKHYLIWNMKFNERSIGTFISEFRDTISFANLQKYDILEEKDDSGKEESDPPPPPDDLKPNKVKKMSQLQGNSELQEMRVPLSGGEAVLFTPQNIDLDDFDILESYLNSFKKVLQKRSLKSNIPEDDQK